jgi:His/Glu/Gln/Arg/opine family amino acid ABC transporter permease subunit
MDQVISWLAILAGGLVVTAELTVASAVLTIVFSMLLAVANISPWRGLRLPALAYADLFRAIPLLALLIFVYYGLGSFTSKVGVPSLWLAVFALTLSESAYLSEIYRGALQAIPRAQWEAASSLGFGWLATVRLVVLPQALLPAIPSTLNMMIGIIKDSSLASLIAVNEVTLTATILVSQTFQPMQVYLVLGLLYLAIIIPLTFLSHRMERRFRGDQALGRGDRGGRYRPPGTAVGEGV